MTIVEAISLLKQYIDYNNTDIPDFYTMAEACEVVIKALEQQPTDIVTDMDCVSRQLVLKQTYNWSKDEFLRVTNPFDYLRKRINSLPTVTPQPCGDCISRSDMLDAVGHGTTYTSEEVQDIIDGMPSVTPQPKMGCWEWVQYDGNPNIGNWNCSECRTIVPRIPEVDNTPIYKWCPMCGANMSEIPTGAEGSDKECK